jgi:hypothetical protein
MRLIMQQSPKLRGEVATRFAPSLETRIFWAE